MTVQSPPPPPAYGGPGAPPPPKKGLSPLAWVGIGCGAIVVIGFLVMAIGGFLAARKIKQFADNPEKAQMAAVELMIRANPDIELVSKDEDAQTFTVRNKKDGTEVTVNLADVKDGNISFETSEGEATFGAGGVTVKDEQGNTTAQMGAGTELPKDLPSWLVYTGGQVQGTLTSDTQDQKTSSFTVSTQDSVEDVIKFYQEQLAANGLEVEQTTTGTGADGATGMISAKSSDDKQNVIIMIGSSSEGAGSSAQVTYVQQK